jgi:TPR repeat protein
MKPTTYRRLDKLLKLGNMKKLDKELEPFLAENDPDARFLSLHFSVAEVSGEQFDARKIEGLHSLAAELHPPALLELAWLYKHGDDGVPIDCAKFKDLLATAALLGNERAKQDLAIYLEFDLGYSGLTERFPREEDNL